MQILPPPQWTCLSPVWTYMSPASCFVIFLSYRDNFLPVCNPEPQITHAHWKQVHQIVHIRFISCDDYTPMLVLYRYTSKTDSMNLLKLEISPAPVDFSCSSETELGRGWGEKGYQSCSIRVCAPGESYWILLPPDSTLPKDNRSAGESLESMWLSDNAIFTTPAVFLESRDDDNKPLTFVRNLNTEAVM